MRVYRKYFFEKKIFKILILLIIIAAIVGIYFISQYGEETEETEEMSDATLPVITTEISGTEYNILYGYTNEMDLQYMMDSISTIDDDYELNIDISEIDEDTEINEIDYEVRSLDGEDLIEDSTLDDWEESDGEISTTIKFDNIMEDDTEYYLIITIKTDDQDIYYYTRVIKDDDINLAKQVKFVEKLHNMTFDKDNEIDLFDYLETDTSLVDTSNLGTVSIYSHYTNVAWGDLSPTQVTDESITIKVLDETIGCYELNYIVSTTSDDDVTEYYNVTEFYRVKVDGSDKYLLYYNRTMDQIFEEDSAEIDDDSINLGIDSDLSVDYTSSEDGTKTCFINEGALWMTDSDDDSVTEIFTFLDEDSDDVRDQNDSYDIEIINVDDDGNIEYLVYGYMNKGEYEGEVGISVNIYNADDDQNEVVGFIPTTQSYEVLASLMGDVYYLNDDNVLYIILDDTLYSIDLDGQESVEIASGLEDGNYVVSDDGEMIAWHQDGELYQTDEIVVLDMETGSSYIVDAEDGTKICAEGFLSDNLVYGTGTEDDFYKSGGEKCLLTSKITVINEDLEVQKEEDSGDYYFTFAEMGTGRIVLSRVTQSLEEYSDLAIYDTDSDDEDAEEASIDVIEDDDDIKGDEVYLYFPDDGTLDEDEVTISKVDTTIFNLTETLSISNIISTEEDKYYVYALGELNGVYTKLATAIKSAYTLEGFVIDESGDYVWQRIAKADSVTLTDTAAESFYEDYTSGELKSVTGTTLTQMLYYLGEREPVVVVGDDFVYVIDGYDSYNIIVWDPDTEESEYMGLEDSTDLFEDATYYIELD